VEEAVGQLAVVGEEEGALDVDVEASDGIQPHDGRHEIGDHGAPLGVVARGDVAGGLVEQQVLPRLGGAHGPAVEPDVVDARIGQRPRLADDDAVDGDAAVEDEEVSSPA
jgi:hypothetical protein